MNGLSPSNSSVTMSRNPSTVCMMAPATTTSTSTTLYSTPSWPELRLMMNTNSISECE